MEFKAAPAVAKDLKAGETIHFEFVQTSAGAVRGDERESHGEHEMIARLIRWSIANRFYVLLMSLALAAWGAWSMSRTPWTRCPTFPTCRSSSAPRIPARRRAWWRTRSPIR
jgi:hypothetical protein